MLKLVCRVCDRPLRPGRRRRDEFPGTVLHAGRGLCRTCYAKHRDDHDTRLTRGPDLLAEVDLMGGPPEETAARLGVTVGAIARAAYRHGRLDIANLYGRVDQRQRYAAKRAAA